MTKKHTAKDYSELAKANDVEWLGKTVPSTKEKTTWRCKLGHKWNTTYGSIKRGYGCHSCGRENANEAKRRKLSDYQKVGKKSGINWTGAERPFDVRTLTTWCCKEGHEWKACYDSIRSGTGCPTCGHQRGADKQRLRASDYRQLGKERDVTWIAEKSPQKALHKTLWKCRESHTFLAAWATVRAGHGCPKCAGNFKLTTMDYDVLGEKRGFLWVGKELPKNSTTTTDWLCHNSHSFRATQSDIKQGRGCPYCARLLRGDRRRLSSDQYHQAAKISGFEWVDVEVPRTTSTPTIWKCLYGHTWKTSKNKIVEGSGCPSCARKSDSERKRLKIADYLEIERLTGNQWLGKTVPKNGTEKTLWQCLEKHTWLAGANKVKRGTGCPECAIERQRLKSNDYHQVASLNNIEWIGVEVPKKNSIKTSWRCHQLHEWTAQYSNIRNGCGCPFCVDILNGKRVSKNQRKLQAMLKRGTLNKRVLNFSVDLALRVKNVKIAIEYDSWYFHGSEVMQLRDARRRKKLRSLGWRTLQIRSDKLLPTLEKLQTAIEKLVNGKQWVCLTLSDWGRGPIFRKQFN